MSRPARVYEAHETIQMRELDGRELASFGTRAAALATDFVLAGALFLILVVPAGMALERLGVIHPARDLTLRLNFFQNWYSVVWLVLYFGLATWLGQGRTPGKRLLGIRVASLHSERLTLWQSVERALGYGASALEFGFGFLQYFIHPNRRTVHDRIADTIVLREPRRRSIAIPEPPAGAEASPE